MSNQAVIEDSDVIEGLSIGYQKIFGVWSIIRDYRLSGKRNAIVKIQVFLTLFFVVPYILCQFLSYFLINMDIQKGTFIFLHTLPHIQTCFKMLVFWFRLDSLSKLYDLVKKDFLSIPESKRSAVDKIYKNIAKESIYFCSASFLANSGIVVMLILDPGVPVDYILYRTGDINAITTGKRKIMGGWYPLPLDKYPFFEVVFAYEAFILIFGCIFLAVYVCLFYQVLMCLYAQFSVLGYHLSTLKLNQGLKRNISIQNNNSSSYKELIGIINDHQKLLSYAKELRSVYNPFVTMILGTGIIFLITSIFQYFLGKTGNPKIILRGFLHLVFQAIDVSMFCFGSSYVESASSDLQFATYSSDWYKADTKFRKAARMLMLRSTKKETLTALRMYPLNVQTMMSIYQFTFSTATLLSQMTE